MHHLRSGEVTLGELVELPRFRSALTEADVKAFRMGAALAILRRTKLESEAIVTGYLLTATLFNESAQSALGLIAWHSYANSREREDWLTRVDFWDALSLKAGRATTEEVAGRKDATDAVHLSSKLGMMLAYSAEFAEECYALVSFSTRHLLACIIGLPSEEIDPDATSVLRQLGAGPRHSRPMFRDWFAWQHFGERTGPLDRVLGVTAEQAKGAFPRDYRPKYVDYNPADEPPGDTRIPDLEKIIAGLREQLANVRTDVRGGLKRDDEIAREQYQIEQKIAAAEAELAELKHEAERDPDLSKSHGVPPSRQLSEWRDGVSGFATGTVQFEDEREVEDALQTREYAHRFARVIALRGTELPLSVGLFGEWGSGKTYFMKLLRQEIRALAATGDACWCGNVVPIRFNAWHYLDTNLWASLVSEMFDQLFDYLAGPDKEAEKRLQTAAKVMAQIQKGKGAAAEAKEAVEVLEREKERAEAEVKAEEKRLRTAKRRAGRVGAMLAARLDNLRAMLPGMLDNPQWKTALAVLGLDKAEASWKEFEKRMAELRTLGGRVRALVNTMGGGRWGALSLVILLTLLWVVPILLGRLAAAVIGNSEPLQPVAMAIGSASGALMSVTGWLAVQVKRARELIRQAEQCEKAARAARAEREKSSRLQLLRELAARLAKRKAAATEKLKAARAKVRRLEEELRELRPERRLFRFIEERAGAKDYRQHLGLVSLVRRDFRELSRLFAEKKGGASDWEKLTGKTEKSIDRIVLYVDDLDRCQPQRVVEVLEAVHLLLDFPLFVAVVAVDPRWVKQSLRAHYSKLLSGGADGAHNGNDNSNSGGDTAAPQIAAATVAATLRRETENDENQATPLDYLEKIFHIPFHLPGMRPDGFKELMEKLTGAAADDDATETIAADARTTEPGETGVPITDPAQGETTRATQEDSGRRARPETATPLGRITEPAAPRNEHQAKQKAPLLGIVKLEPWEITRLNDYGALVRTPRAAKRFLNTYRLVRAGLPQRDWDHFRGDGNATGEFRVAMLLLAAAAGSPVLAREWFRTLRLSNPDALSLPENEADTGRPEWQRFKRAYGATVAEVTPVLSGETLAGWLDRVERFSF